MRKMTYKQAATCGENLKVRVTPEQSEKMQLAWFAAGKTWSHGSREVLWASNLFLFLRKKMATDSNSMRFPNSCDEEIKLIDEPQPDFASEQAISLWVAQGNQVKNIAADSIVGFKGGSMWNFTVNTARSYVFANFENWKNTPHPA